MRRDLIVVGAGPAGLCAAIEAAGQGLDVVVYDENAKPGGQLFKQIHKFFGSKEHRARERGFRIGEQLLQEAADLGVEVVLGAPVIGLYQGLTVQAQIDARIERVRANGVILATGASENMIPFPGWTLPGVIGAGAAQTMANLHGIRPGNDLLMVGCGNVGVVVAYQMLQAGCRVRAMIDAGSTIGGYGVHAAKVARTGVPFHLGHTIVRAEGDARVESATIAQVDDRWQPVPGTEKQLDVDTVCLAVGLSPSIQLAAMAGCRMLHLPEMGGRVPVRREDCSTSVSGLYVVGDAGGIEEASSAMIQGRMAGMACAMEQGFISPVVGKDRLRMLRDSLDRLREGPFGERIRGAENRMQAVLPSRLEETA